MPSTEGFVQAYNAQAAVDLDSYLIVENHLTQQSNDKQEVKPTLAGLQVAEVHSGNRVWHSERSDGVSTISSSRIGSGAR